MALFATWEEWHLKIEMIRAFGIQTALMSNNYSLWRYRIKLQFGEALHVKSSSLLIAHVLLHLFGYHDIVCGKQKQVSRGCAEI